MITTDSRDSFLEAIEERLKDYNGNKIQFSSFLEKHLNLLITVLLVDLLVAEVLKSYKSYCILQAVTLSKEKHVWNLFEWHLAD